MFDQSEPHDLGLPDHLAEHLTEHLTERPAEQLTENEQPAEPQSDTSPTTGPPRRTVRILRNTRTPGLPGARNTGITQATGEFVAFCDDDDEWLPGKLRAQFEQLRHHPEASAVASGILVHFRGQDRPRLPTAESLSHADFLRDRQMAVHPSTLVFRRADLLDETAGIGLVDEEIPGGYGEDYDLLLRAARRAPVIAVSRPQVRVYWHESSYFFDRWQTIVNALGYLLRKHPEFAGDRAGLARLHGQIAFAYAGMGQRRPARAHAVRALRGNWREKRSVLALLVSTGLVRAQFLSNLSHRFGRGI
ncbi:glycosyltransferase family 2 protein [Kineosporia babensis]|uniref:Glycosyltransferase family 2 protein n=1 Tax=Kineosporia babensis TaxID=499548 RepID=A0A9X1NKQ6_9ACTN|nr:glycosyltransferase family 2 protein [Kineosporia babensis]